MKIAKQFAFNTEEYMKELEDCKMDKDDFMIIYEYVNKIGEDTLIKVDVSLIDLDKQTHIAKKGALITDDGRAFTASLVFDDIEEFKKFVAPVWLEELEEATN